LIAWFATRQAGHVARRQLLATGVSRGVIDRLVAKGHLIVVLRGVYRVAHEAPSPFAREFAAVLGCGPGALVSHRSAAWIYDVLAYPAIGDVWLASTAERGKGVRGVRVQRTRRMSPRDVQFKGWLPLTSPARTLLDVAGIVGAEQLEQAVAAAQGRQLVRETDLRGQLARSGGCRGAKALRALLDRHTVPADARSRAERLMLRLVRNAGLPEPLVNSRFGRWRPDFYWPEYRLVAEFDSWGFHTDIGAFRRDREKSNQLQLQGIMVLRFTWYELTRTPERLVGRLRAAMRQHARGLRD
jgi:very-short-patch-repair endonuclease